MAAKQLRFEAPARAALARGAAIVADTVAVTLGPRGRTVVLDKKFGPPLISNDGVTIARELELEDHFENMGAQLLKEVAIKTNDVAGDGTTTATVLARAMLDEGLRNLAAGAPPNDLRRGMMAACDATVESIRARSHPVKGGDDILRVATISSGDAAIGAMIADAFDKVGKEGVVSIEDGTGIETEIEVVEGMQFDRGYISAHLVTDLQNMESVLNDARVLVTDAKISSVSDLLPSLELVMRAGRPLLIIAEDIQAEALATLVVNRARGTFSAMAVKAPAFGERREAILQDIAVLTGATVISEKTGLRLDAVRDDQLGVAGRVTVTKDDTTIVRGGGSKAAIEARNAGDPPPDGGDDLRLGSREAPGAACAPDRWRRRHQGRRCHRGRDEGAQVSRRGRACGHPCGNRGRRGRRWRGCVAAGHSRGPGAQARGRRDASAPRSSPGRSASRCASSPRTPASKARSWSTRSPRPRATTGSML